MNITAVGTVTVAALAAWTFAVPVLAQQQSEAEIAKKTQNPVADLISLPFKLDYDHKIGPRKEGEKFQLTVQPVIPISIDEKWNVISRTLVPVIHLNDITPDSGKHTGLGDINPQFYFSPKAPTADGWIWGLGPQALLRTGNDDVASQKWGLGPTGVLLKQEHGWTYGVLANHMWSVAGSNQSKDISSSFVQPFLTYTTHKFTTFGVNSESTYDWKSNKWSVPVNAWVSQMLRVHGQLLTLEGGVRYWAASPDDIGPKRWGLRFQVTFLFPE